MFPGCRVLHVARLEIDLSRASDNGQNFCKAPNFVELPTTIRAVLTARNSRLTNDQTVTELPVMGGVSHGERKEKEPLTES